MIGRNVSHYRILEPLGEGGMGVVFKAEDTRLRRTVALKFLRPDALHSREQREHLLREARAAAALDHPNICTIYEIGEEGEQVFISMAFLEGDSLAQRVKLGALPVGEALRIAERIARGLEAAHERGIVHRDIKSGNVIVTPRGEVRIMDFGLAVSREAAQLETIDLGKATPAYMSPEHIRRETIDERTDIWSWGVVLYEMLAGRLPFTADSPGVLVRAILRDDPPSLVEANPAVPAGLERIVRRALAKRPADRYQSVSELLADLRAVETLPSIAVLAFADMSPEHDQEHFCDGIADEIIHDLMHVERLRVAARTSSFAFKAQAGDIREIGRRLGVATVLEGSVRKAGRRVRIAAQLINVADGCHLWSAHYDRELEDVFAIQEEIARHIVEALRVELSDREVDVLRRVATRDLEAWDYYQRGRQFFYRSNRRSIEFALEMFSRATALDPDYARAYAGAANCHAYLFMYFGRDERELQLADEASRRALELADDLAEAHAARGLVISLSQRYAEAETEFEAAIRLNASLFEAWYFYARTCFGQGKVEQAATLFEQASRVDPDEYQAPMLLAFIRRGLHRDEEADVAYARAYRNAERQLRLNPDDARALYVGGTSLAELGRTDEGERWVDRAMAMEPEDPYILYGGACFYARLGRIEDAIRLFGKSVEGGFRHWEWIDNDTDLHPLREDPRFRAILDRHRDA